MGVCVCVCKMSDDDPLFYPRQGYVHAHQETSDDVDENRILLCVHSRIFGVRASTMAGCVCLRVISQLCGDHMIARVAAACWWVMLFWVRKVDFEVRLIASCYRIDIRTYMRCTELLRRTLPEIDSKCNSCDSNTVRMKYAMSDCQQWELMCAPFQCGLCLFCLIVKFRAHRYLHLYR